MTNTNNFDQIHRDHQIAKLNILKAEKEVKKFKEELGDIVTQSGDINMKKVGHFESSFARQKEVINGLLQLISKADHLLGQNETIPKHLIEANNVIMKDAETFDKIYAELKTDFISFKNEPNLH